MDPRPDLPDAWLWGPLLAAAREREGDGVYGTLHGLRCWGAGVERDGAGFRLVAGGMDPEEYAEERRRLLPHAEALRRLLRGGSAAAERPATESAA